MDWLNLFLYVLCKICKNKVPELEIPELYLNQ